MISLGDFQAFADEALDAMVAMVEELGDERANRRPARHGANTPYAILAHCLGVMEWWGGHVVAGRAASRDRDAEFRSGGPVADLVARARVVRDRFAGDVAGSEPHAPPRGTVGPDDADRPSGRTQGGALFHVYQELAQHLGQMEGCRDVLTAPWAALVTTDLPAGSPDAGGSTVPPGRPASAGAGVTLVGLEHVQLAIPPGGEDRCRAFWSDLLGMVELPKPPVLAARGGCWFQAGGAQVHVGVEDPFAPATKAHPGLLVDDLHRLATVLEHGGHPVRWDDSVPGVERFHSDDPFGNRLEFIQAPIP